MRNDAAATATAMTTAVVLDDRSMLPLDAPSSSPRPPAEDLETVVLVVVPLFTHESSGLWFG